MCDYFILTKPNNCDIGNDDKNQIICVKEKVYILPKNIINYYITPTGKKNETKLP